MSLCDNYEQSWGDDSLNAVSMTIVSDLELYLSESTQYKRSRRRAPPRYRVYNEESLRGAVCAVYSGEMSQTRASKVFGVPRQTIGSRLDKMKSLQ